MFLGSVNAASHVSGVDEDPPVVGVSSLSPAGTRDRGGRALLTVCTGSSVWSNPDCDQAQLLRLLLYYTSTLRYEPPPGSQLCVRLLSSCSASNILSCVEQEGGASAGAGGAGGRPQSSSCPRSVLRPQVPAGESETKQPAERNFLYFNMSTERR